MLKEIVVDMPDTGIKTAICEHLNEVIITLNDRELFLVNKCFNSSKIKMKL